MIRNPIIGLRIAKNGDFIFEFYGEDGNRAEVVFTTADDLDAASNGFDWARSVREFIDENSYDEALVRYELEIDPTNDYQVIDPDQYREDEPF